MKLDPTKAAQLEKIFVEVAQQIRETLGDMNIGSFLFKAKATGRTNSGDMEVKFHVGDSEYSDSVKSFAITPALEETMRRNGWEKVNKPLCLPRVADAPAPEMSSSNDNSSSEIEDDLLSHNDESKAESDEIPY